MYSTIFSIKPASDEMLQRPGNKIVQIIDKVAQQSLILMYLHSNTRMMATLWDPWNKPINSTCVTSNNELIQTQYSLILK